LSSTEVENDLQNAKHKRIPSESTDSCLPARCTFICVYVRRGPPPQRRTAPLCVFFTLFVFSPYKVTSAAQIKD